MNDTIDRSADKRVCEAHEDIAVQPIRLFAATCDHPQVTEAVSQQCAFAIEVHALSLHL